MKINEALNIAAKEIGTTEYPPNSNNVKYNTWYYGHEVKDGHPKPNSTYPWCVAFIEWIFRAEPALIMKTASCSTLASWFKQRKAFYTKEAQPGDLCFMKFGKKKAFATHIGIVESVKGNTIITIEGNTGNESEDNGGAVMRKERKSNIVGFGRPKYSDTEAPTQPTHPTLEVGSKGSDVVYLHKLLKSLGYGVDINVSIYNQLTKQCVMHVQASNALEIDGICGPLTWAVLEK